MSYFEELFLFPSPVASPFLLLGVWGTYVFHTLHNYKKYVHAVCEIYM